MDSSQGHVAFHIEKQSIRKCLKYIFGCLLLMNFAKDCTSGSCCEKLGQASLPSLVSTDPPPSKILQSYDSNMFGILHTEKNW